MPRKPNTPRDRAGECVELQHERYGSFEDHPHTTIQMTFGEWNEAAQEALGYKLGPPIAWEHNSGTLYLWGEHLDDDTLRDLSDACHDIEREHSDMGIYEAAERASRVSTKFIRAEVLD